MDDPLDCLDESDSFALSSAGSETAGGVGKVEVDDKGEPDMDQPPDLYSGIVFRRDTPTRISSADGSANATCRS